MCTLAAYLELFRRNYLRKVKTLKMTVLMTENSDY